MYDYIKGKLARKAESYAVVEANGVGYKIITTKSSLANIKDGEVTFYTYLYVREDIFDLYGFSTIEERSAFELLISVNIDRGNFLIFPMGSGQGTSEIDLVGTADH